MRLKKALFLILVGTSFAETSVDPISDKLRFKIAVAQRDFIGVKPIYEKALEALKASTEEAEGLCSTVQKTFDANTFSCVDKPAAAPRQMPPPPLPPVNPTRK